MGLMQRLGLILLLAVPVCIYFVINNQEHSASEKQVEMVACQCAANSNHENPNLDDCLNADYVTLECLAHHFGAGVPDIDRRKTVGTLSDIAVRWLSTTKDYSSYPRAFAALVNYAGNNDPSMLAINDFVESLKNLIKEIDNGATWNELATNSDTQKIAEVVEEYEY